MGNEQVKDVQAEPASKATPATSSSAPAEKPDTNFFAPGKIAKWAEQSGLSGGEQKADALKSKEPETKKPEPEKEKGTPEPDKTPEPAKPYRVIEVDGRKVEIKSEEEFLDLARKSLQGEKSGEGRPDVTQNLDRLIAALEKQIATPDAGKTEDLANRIGDVDLDLLDPSLAKLLKDQQNQNDRLKKISEQNSDYIREKKFEDSTAQVEKIIESVRKDFPFTDFSDKDLGRNVTQDLFTGIVAARVNEDNLQKRPLRKVDEYMKIAAETVHRFEKHVKGQAEPVTASLIAEKHPAVLKEIREAAVADYLREKGEATPTPRSGRAEPVPRGSDNKAKPRNLHESLIQGLSDPVIEAGLEEAARESHRPS